MKSTIGTCSLHEGFVIDAEVLDGGRIVTVRCTGTLGCCYGFFNRPVCNSASCTSCAQTGTSSCQVCLDPMSYNQGTHTVTFTCPHGCRTEVMRPMGERSEPPAEVRT